MARRITGDKYGREARAREDRAMMNVHGGGLDTIGMKPCRTCGGFGDQGGKFAKKGGAAACPTCHGKGMAF
ncbi:MAG: hypothetical protein WC683_13145 [bacterium]